MVPFGIIMLKQEINSPTIIISLAPRSLDLIVRGTFYMEYWETVLSENNTECRLSSALFCSSYCYLENENITVIIFEIVKLRFITTWKWRYLN